MWVAGSPLFWCYYSFVFLFCLWEQLPATGIAFIWILRWQQLWFLLFALGSVTGRCLYLRSLNRGCKGKEDRRVDLYFRLSWAEGWGRFFLSFAREEGCSHWTFCGSRYSHHLPKEEKCSLGRLGEEGDLDLGLFGLRVGGWNHLLGVPGHWCDSGSSSSSGDPLRISSTTGGRSSRGMQEVEAASGGSSPTSITESGKSACGGVCEGSVSLWPLFCESEIASLGGSAKDVFLFIAR